MTWLQLDPGFRLLPIAGRLILGRRGGSSFTAVDGRGLDLEALRGLLVRGTTHDLLCARAAAAPDQHARVERAIAALRATGALLESEDGEGGNNPIGGFPSTVACLAAGGAAGPAPFAMLTRLRRSRILVLDAARLATWTMHHLAAAGVGAITVVDGGRVGRADLAGNALVTDADVGRPQVEVAVDRLARAAPGTEVRAERMEVTSPEDVASILGARPGFDLVLAASDRDQDAALAATIACRALGVPLLCGRALTIGPLFIPTETSCPRCGLGPRARVGQRLAYYRDRLEDDVPCTPPISAQAAAAAAVLAQEALWFLADRRAMCRSLNQRLVVGASLEIAVRPAPRDPSCRVCREATGAERGVRFGYGRDFGLDQVELVRPPVVAPFVKAHAVYVDDRLPVQGGEPHLAGHGFGLDPQRVRRQALAELVEHASSFYRGLDARRFVVGSYAQLCDGHRLVQLEALRYYDPRQRLPGWLVPLAPDTVITWTEARPFPDGEPLLVPALLAYLLWRPAPGEPRFALPDATGLAAHRTAAAAALHGWQEVVERDAAMLSWKVAGWPVRRVAADALSADFRRAAASLCDSIELFDIGRPDCASVLLAIVSNAGGAATTCGTACRATLVEAAEHAVEEALMLRHAVIELGRSTAPLAPPTSSIEHVMRAFARGHEVLAWYRDQARRATRERDGFRAPGPAMAQTGPLAPALIVDATDARARASGWFVTRTLVPAAQPRESDGRFPYLGTPALSRAQACWSRGAEINRAPHPFG
jgi:thiazole/oxazole-forming peptide maturase SagD family component